MESIIVKHEAMTIICVYKDRPNRWGVKNVDFIEK
jgi:hypothetical protein